MIVHVLQRVVLAVLGYLAALATATASFLLMLMLISFAVPDGGLWDWLGLGPVFALAIPVVFTFLLAGAAAFTAVPAAVAGLVAEALALRALPVHLGLALAVGLTGSFRLDASWFAGMSSTKWLITLAAVVAALAGGAVHWLIAGRNAGLRRAR